MGLIRIHYPSWVLILWSLKADVLAFRIKLDSRVDEASVQPYAANDAGAYRCNQIQWTRFLHRFGAGNGSLALRAGWIGNLLNLSTNMELSYYTKSKKKPCKKDNVLWLMGLKDGGNAFKYNEETCYRLLAWSENSCSVVVKKINTNDEAITVLNRYSADSIKHLVFAAHGYGSTTKGAIASGGLQWATKNNLETEKLRSLQVIAAAGEKVVPSGTILVDSCYGASLHKEESLAHYISRIVGKGISVIGAVYSFSGAEMAVEVVPDQYKAAVIHGTRTFMHDHAQYRNLPAQIHDWVRCFYWTSSGEKSHETTVGVVAGDFPYYSIRMKIYNGGIQDNIPREWITRMVKPGQAVFRPGKWKERPPSRMYVYQGPNINIDAQLQSPDPSKGPDWFVLRDPQNGIDFGVEDLWPVGQLPPIIGKLYPERGSWVRTERKTNKRGVVLQETGDGALVLFEDGKRMGVGSSSFKDDVARPGDMIEYYEEKGGDLVEKIRDGIVEKIRGKDLFVAKVLRMSSPTLQEISDKQEAQVLIHDVNEAEPYLWPAGLIERAAPEKR